jgi:hypothetical protein
MKTKVQTWAMENGSLNAKIAKRNIPLGAIYCSSPTVESKIRLAPSVKKSSGTAVTKEAPIRSKSIPWLTLNIDPIPFVSK